MTEGGMGKQVREDCPGPLVAWYRHISKGAWPFSTRDHGWPISDCSSEGLKVPPLPSPHSNLICCRSKRLLPLLFW